MRLASSCTTSVGFRIILGFYSSVYSFFYLLLIVQLLAHILPYFQAFMRVKQSVDTAAVFVAMIVISKLRCYQLYCGYVK